MALALESIRGRLADEVEVLRDGRTGRLDLRELLRELQLPVRVVVRDAPGAEARLIRNRGSHEIVMYRRPQENVSRARRRFTLAHEIAHFWIDAKFGFRPSRKAEYWQLEELCDRFAVALLIDDATIREARVSHPTSSRALYEGTVRLARLADVSFQAAGFRLVDVLSAASYCELAPTHDPQAVGVVQWSRESRPWIGVGPGKKVRPQDPLASLWHAAQNEVRDVSFQAATVAIERRGRAVRVVAWTDLPTETRDRLGRTVSGPTRRPRPAGQLALKVDKE